MHIANFAPIIFMMKPISLVLGFKKMTFYRLNVFILASMFAEHEKRFP
jgi:hypothetical protein